MILTEDGVIKHNKHILAVSGGDFGVLNNNGLQFAIDSVNNEQSPVLQATNFLYYIANGHVFLEGNKRTAFEISKGLLASGGQLFEAPEQEIVGFITGSVAQNKVSREEVKNWLSSYTKPTDEKIDFDEITDKNIENDKELLKKLD